ncbi:MAG TPA: site-specific integrase [Candidatus Xenobia bacterium]|jgi:integrase
MKWGSEGDVGKSERGVYPYKDGWGVRYKDADGRTRHKTGFATKPEAIRERKRLVGLSLDGRATVPAAFPTVEQYVEEYLATSLKKRPRDDRLHAATWCKVLGKYGLDQLSAAHIRTLKKQWAPVLAPATIDRRLAWFSAVLNTAIKDGWDIKNVVHQAGLMRGYDNRRKRELSPAEEEQLLGAWDRLGLARTEFYKVEVAINTSLRQGEEFNMRWSDLDFQHRTITVPHTKPGRVKHVPMTSRVFAILTELAAAKRPGQQWVWVGPRGRKLAVRNWLRDYWEPAVREAGLENLCWHDLRHTTASRLRRAGVDLATIKEILGQSDLRMTERYAHINNEQMAAAMSRLDR